MRPFLIRMSLEVRLNRRGCFSPGTNTRPLTSEAVYRRSLALPHYLNTPDERILSLVEVETVRETLGCGPTIDPCDQRGPVGLRMS